jgi:hypothetical protein
LRSVRNAYNFNLAASSVAVNTVKGTASAAKETGTIATRAGRESLEKAKQKQESKKSGM